MPHARYAIYFTPPPGALADLGAAWLGWNSAAGRPAGPLDIPDLPAPIAEITDAPRRYGLHATLAPPFRSTGTEDALHAAFTRFCRGTAPVMIASLQIAAMGRFLALVPGTAPPALGALAAGAVRAVDPLRAPLSEAELARRRSASLTPDQDANLVRWGYPYVMSAFRFHITLTGKRPRAELPAIRDALARHMMPAVPCPFPVDAASLMGEDSQGRFHLLRRQALGPG
jgi:hypothetical protein